MTLEDAALEYIEEGRSIIPIRNGTKKPLAAWEQFQRVAATPEQVEEWFKKWPDAQIAMVTGLVSGVAVIDGDSKAGNIWIKQNLPRTTVYQKTPNGAHVFYRTNGRPVKNKVRIAPDVDVRGDGGYVLIAPSKHPSGKIYELVFPVEGSGWEDLTEFPYDKLPQADKKPVKYDPVDEGERNITTARIAGKLIKDGADYQGMLDYLLFQNSRCNPPQPEQDVEKTAKSIWKTHFENHPFDKPLSNPQQSSAEISKSANPSAPPQQILSNPSAISPKSSAQQKLFVEIKEYLIENPGFVTNRDICYQFDLKTRTEKNRLYRALSDLKLQGIASKVPGKPGHWRIIDAQADPIDMFSESPKCLPIPLPLGLSSMVKIHSKDIIVCAGTTNSGKSSFLTSVGYMAGLLRGCQGQIHIEKENIYIDTVKNVLADKTMDYKSPMDQVCYMNSESPDELKRRVQSYPMAKMAFSKMEAYERMNNFVDLIKPNAINIIDYMEIVRDFHEVAGFISEIYQALDQGVAFIALQKKSNEQFARGGEFSAEKARLYLTLENNAPFGGICRIGKAKSFPAGKNPNGLEVDYKIYGGWRMEPVSRWRYVGAKERARANKQYEADLSADKEYAYEFKLTDGTTAGLNYKDRNKWIKQYPDAGVDKHLKSVARASEFDPWMTKDKWFFQLIGSLKKLQKAATTPVQQKIIDFDKGGRE